MAQELKIKQNTSLQTPIEVALAINEDGMTTASAVYEWLELDRSNYARWCRQNILENNFAEENRDFVRFVIYDETPTGGKIERSDYYLTANFAKKICMASHTERGEQARQYFLGCETALATIVKHSDELIQKQFARLIQGYNRVVAQLDKTIETSETALETVDKVSARVAEVASGETVAYSWSNSAYERVKKIGEQYFPDHSVKEIITAILDEMNIVLDPYIDAYKVTHPNEKSIYRLRVIGFFDELIYPFEKCLKKYEQEVVPEDYDAIAMSYAEWEENQL